MVAKEMEQPKIANPEREAQSFFNENLSFTRFGQITSENERLKHTITMCNLNRDDLVKLRAKVITDLKNDILRSKYSYQRDQNKQEYDNRILDIFQAQIGKIIANEAYTALRRFLVAERRAVIAAAE